MSVLQRHRYRRLGETMNALRVALTAALVGIGIAGLLLMVMAWNVLMGVPHLFILGGLGLVFLVAFGVTR